MEITYNERERVFHLTTPWSSYLIGITDEGFLAHLYYGKLVTDDNLKQLLWIGFERETAFSETGDQIRFLNSLDRQLIRRILSKDDVTAYILEKGSCEPLAAWIRRAVKN